MDISKILEMIEQTWRPYIIIIVLVFIAAIIVYSLLIIRHGGGEFNLFNLIKYTIRKPPPAEESEPKSKISNDDISKPVNGTISSVSSCEAKYYLGIDIGRNKIDYCIIDSSQSLTSERDYPKHSINTPQTLDLFEFSKDFSDNLTKLLSGTDYPINGIGFGLPGQINPKEGIFITSPGFDLLNGLTIYDFKKILNKNSEIKRMGKIRIAMDNDVRCATRYIWKKYNVSDSICIFSGIGLGSGIIIGGKLHYGYNFTAGEIGHSTISGCPNFAPECFTKKVIRDKCECGKDGYHMEMLVARDGVLRIAKNLNEGEYNKFKDRHKDHFNNDKELTTEFLSDAYYKGDPYAYKVVQCFIEYLAIGVANYINIINPEKLYLGGGIIRGFFQEKLVPIGKLGKGRKSKDILTEKIRQYALNASIDPFPDIKIIDESNIAAKGAALIFEDETYSEYIGKMWVTL